MPKHQSLTTGGGTTTAHQKLHALYQGVLQTSPILTILAAGITWPKVMELMTVKHFTMGHTVWRAGQVPTDMGFVLEGQFELQTVHDNNASGSAITKVCPRGSCIAGHATVTHTPLNASVVATKYKSTLMTLSRSKFATVLHQLEASRAEQLQHALLTAYQEEMRALYPPTAVTPLTNPRLLPAPVVAVSPQPPPTTVPVEYESSSGTLVLHEPIRSRRGSLKPRLHPICVQARANMVRRLEQLHIPEQYQPGDSTTLVRKPFGHHNAGTVTKEKPMGRLLRPLDKQKDPHIIHAEREFACGSSSPSNLYDSSLTLMQSTPNIPQPTGHHRPLPPVNKPHIRIDQLSVQQHTTALGPVIPPTSMPPLMNPLQRQCTVPSPQSPA